MGLDSDHPRSLGEVGREGVAVDTLADMETLFSGIPFEDVSVSMTINAPAPIMLAYYVVAAERRGVPPEALAGTIQTDILKEYIAQKEWCFPIDPAMRLVTDMIEWCSGHMPRWHPISISGYHIREAGSTAAQELAFTLKDGLTYVEHALERGVDIDDFAPRLSFFFNAHMDFFEEIAKYRAARRIWAREMRDTYGARNERFLADALPLADGRRLAHRPAAAQQHRAHRHRGARRGARRHPVAAHQLLRRGARAADRGGGAGRTAHPAGDRARDRVTNTIDPLGGSYFVEALTDEMEAKAYEYFAKIDELGGMVEAVKRGYPQREIAEASFQYQQEVESGERKIVGVNAFVQEDEPPLEILKIDAALEGKQIERVKAVREARDPSAASAALEALRQAAEDENANTMPLLLDAARAPT